MTIQTIKIDGKRYVIIRESDYLSLKKSQQRTPVAKRPAKRVKRLTAQDRGDVAEAVRRQNEPSLPYARLREELGLK